MTDEESNPEPDPLPDPYLDAWIDATGEGPQGGPSLPDLTLVSDQVQLRDELKRFLMPYKFAIDEVTTKLQILQEEFTHTGEYNPIEHFSGRLKDPESIVEKTRRRGVPLHDLASVRETITDIAGVRVVCSFISDVYRVFELLTAQRDVRVHTVKDYIAKPKENGYRSLHLILELPVFLSNGPVDTLVEVQIRTIAMDFWASLEHKIYYKYDREVPARLLEGLHDAAEQAGQLDASMEWLHIAIRGGDRDTTVRRSADALLATEQRDMVMRMIEPVDAQIDAAPGPETVAETAGTADAGPEAPSVSGDPDGVWRAAEVVEAVEITKTA